MESFILLGGMDKWTILHATLCKDGFVWSTWLLARMGIYTRTLLKYGQNIKCCWAVKIDSVGIINGVLVAVAGLVVQR